MLQVQAGCCIKLQVQYMLELKKGIALLRSATSPLRGAGCLEGRQEKLPPRVLPRMSPGQQICSMPIQVTPNSSRGNGEAEPADCR